MKPGSQQRLKLVLEGPPGAGKTTTLAALVQGLSDRCSFFSEPCLALHDPALDRTGTPGQQTAWHLAYQRQQYRRITDAHTRTPVVVCDRNHLGVLAYAYACELPDRMPYRIARERFLRDVEPIVPSDLETVILLVSTEESLGRRGGRPALPRWRHWYHPGFLDRLREFYTELAYDLCPAPPLVINTDGRAAVTTLNAVTRRLAAKGIKLNCPALPAQQYPDLDPAFAGEYARAGGLGVLGRPVTYALIHRHQRVQLFEHGVLRVDAEGPGTRGGHQG